MATPLPTPSSLPPIPNPSPRRPRLLLCLDSLFQTFHTNGITYVVLCVCLHPLTMTFSRFPRVAADIRASHLFMAWPNGIPSCRSTTFCLSSHQADGHWVVSTLGFFGITGASVSNFVWPCFHFSWVPASEWDPGPKSRDHFLPSPETEVFLLVERGMWGTYRGCGGWRLTPGAGTVQRPPHTCQGARLALAVLARHR